LSVLVVILKVQVLAGFEVSIAVTVDPIAKAPKKVAQLFVFESES
jgi:hypothetical protein